MHTNTSYVYDLKYFKLLIRFYLLLFNFIINIYSCPRTYLFTYFILLFVAESCYNLAQIVRFVQYKEENDLFIP